MCNNNNNNNNNTMILEHSQWCFGYEQILKDCRPGDETEDADGALSSSSSKAVLLLCNADVDAMSSARILSYMLRSDGLHYQLLPCQNYTDLKENLASRKEDLQQEIRAVVLLNFGASYNLTRLYEEGYLQTHTKIYVLDCRRPIHLANVYAPSSVVVFLDSTQKLKDMPSDGDNLSGSESSSSEEDSDDDSDDRDSDSDSDKDSDNDDSDKDEDEEEANFDDVVGESNTFGTTKDKDESIDTSYDAGDEDDDDDDDQEENDENKDPSKRESKRQKMDPETSSTATSSSSTPNEYDKEPQTAFSNNNHPEDPPVSQPSSRHEPPPSQASFSLQPSELHRLRKSRLRKYYSEGSFYGSPCSYISYQLATQNRYGEQGDLLWLACVGVTDAYLHNRLDLIGYAQLAKDLSNSISKLYPSSFFDRALNTVYAEDLNNSNNQNHRTATQTKIALSEQGRILAEKDFRFFLLRHSSLLDSMQYSQYVCTKLQLYTKKGEQKLLELLAKMGYPLDECKQPFCFMRPGLRRRLKQKLGTHAMVSLNHQGQ